jgi:hypothetical protein
MPITGRDQMEAEYYEDVNNLASSIKDAYNNGEIADRDGLLERVHEEVDSCGRVIYTARAQEACIVSRNASAGIESLGSQGFDWSNGIPWSALAFFAVEADVYDALREEGIDPNDDFKVCDKHNKPYADECEACTESDNTEEEEHETP